jgi:hypothetical protein
VEKSFSKVEFKADSCRTERSFPYGVIGKVNPGWRKSRCLDLERHK